MLAKHWNGFCVWFCIRLNIFLTFYFSLCCYFNTFFSIFTLTWFYFKIWLETVTKDGSETKPKNWKRKKAHKKNTIPYYFWRIMKLCKLKRTDFCFSEYMKMFFFTIPKCDIRSVFECFNTIKEIKIKKVCEKHKIRTSHKHKKTDVHLQDRCSLRIEKNEQTIARYIFQKLNQIAY